MKKFINAVDNLLGESLDGFAAAHADLVVLGAERKFVRRRELNGRKVALVSGGGSGHEPLHAGFVGYGMLDAACPGQVFTSPTPDQIVEAAQAVAGDAGVLFIVKNYAGDRMNFEMAAEMLELEGMKTASVRVSDDVASAPPEQREKRRGVAGLVLVYKAAGARAASGATLEEVAATARKANDACRTIGVALTPCVVPESGKPSFEIADDEVEFGMGIHGEPGIWRGPLKTADALADEMLERVLPELAVSRGDRLAVLVNSLGATPSEELYILYRRISSVLAGRGVDIAFSLVGRYATSMEMAGASLSVMKLDPDLEALLAAPATCPFWSVR